MLKHIVLHNKTSTNRFLQQKLQHHGNILKTTTRAASNKIEVANFEKKGSESLWKTFGDITDYKPGKYQIQTYNKISQVGLKRFGDTLYDVHAAEIKNPHAILLRSHKLQEEQVKPFVRAIARCGAGTNNVPVDRMTELGIPVFNTPGANANAVKELVIAALFLGSRRVIDGINHMKELGRQGIAKERVEKDKAKFGGRELNERTLAVIGLGHIGASTARDAARIGMNIVGFDPAISIESALKLPRRPMTLVDSIAAAVSKADYISLNIPYIKGKTHHIINEEIISKFSKDVVLVNFARGELVDGVALKNFLDKNEDARYISDFPDDALWDHKNVILIPHLGASTEEAEDAAASMAADTIRAYLETGTIKNSVNFPNTTLPATRPPNSVRFAIVNQNTPGMLSNILETFAKNDLNIIQQINQSKGTIAYNVVDLDLSDYNDKDVISFKNIQKEITMLDGVLSSRIIYGVPGSGYAKNIKGDYFV